MSEEYETDKAAVPASAPVTPISDNREKYRHFAVHKDAEREILYFCDLNPLVTGMLCYSSDRKAAENTWTGTFTTICAL